MSRRMAANAGSVCASSASHDIRAPGSKSIDSSRSSESRENWAGLKSMIDADDAGD